MNSEHKAIPFVLKNPHTQVYQLSPQAEIFLKNINGPLSIVTVAGLYRTGKSYLLNRVILNKSQGFNVGPTINPCTKGLWIWNQSIHTQQNKNVLVIDTQGLGALDEQSNHDMKIFSLAVLLSTTFIYNSVGNIDQNALQTLSLVLNLVGNIDQENQSSRPSFVWVVRDFSLQLVDEKGNTISSKQYLQKALNSDGIKQSQKAGIRKNITNAFNNRDCFTLVKPLIDQNKLQRLDSIPLQELRPEFVSQTMALRKRIFNNLHSIKLSNSQLKGADYIIMVKRYLQAINQGVVPNILDTWTFIKEEKAREVSAQLIQNYSQKIKNKLLPKLPLKFAQLQEFFSSMWSEMVQDFKKLTYEQTSTQEVEQFYRSIKSKIKAVNQDQMKKFLKNLLTKQFQTFSKKMYSDYYESIQEFATDLQKNFKYMLITTYSQKAQGLQASISSFLQRKYIDSFKYFSTKLKLQIKKVTQTKQEIEDSYKKQVQSLKSHSIKYQSELKQKIMDLDRKVIQLTRRNEDNQKLLQIQKNENKDKGFQMKQRLQTIQQNMMNLQQRNNQLQGQKKSIERQLFVFKKQNDKQMALMRQKNDYLVKQNEQQERRNQEMKKIIDEKISVQQQQKKKYFSSNQQKLNCLVQQTQLKSDKIFQLQHKIRELREEYEQKIYKLQQKQRRLLQQKQKMKINLTQDFSNKKQSQANQINNLRDQCRKYEQQLQMSLIQRTEIDNKFKHLSEELKHIKYSSQKQIAIHLQKIQFQQAEIKELKTSQDQTKKNYQAMIQNIQSSTKGSQEISRTRIKDITEQYENQIKSMDKQFSQKIYQTKKQLSSIKTAKEDLQIQLSLQRKKHQSKEKEFKETYFKLEMLYKNLTQKVSNSQKNSNQINQQKENYLNMRIKQLQTQIQQIKQKYIRQLQESQKSSDQALAVLKNYTQMQRNQWEKRLQDQKDKHNRYMQNLKFQLQKKLMQEKQVLQEQNSMLQQKINEMQKYFNQTLQNMKYNNQIQNQKLSNQFMQQKVELTKRNALLTQQMQLTKINMQNQIDDIKRNYQQNIQSVKKQLQNEIKQQQIRYKEEKQFLESKCETLKKTNKSVEQQNLIVKNELDKQKALWKQKQSSHLRNITDLQDRLSHQLFNHTKTIEDITNANNHQRKRLNSQIDSLKSYRSKLQQEKSALAMQKDTLQTKFSTKLTYLENKIKTNKADYDDLMNKFQLTSTYLNKKIQSLLKQKQELHTKVKSQFQQQIGVKQDNYKKQNKEYNDRIYRLQTENKSLRDKIILMEVKLGSQTKNNYQNMEFQKVEAIKQEYQNRQEQYKRLVQKLKKDIKKLREQKQLLELTSGFDKSKHNQTAYKDFSERDSIINGLNQQSRYEASRSRVNMDNSKIMNTSNFNQSRMTNVNPLGENKNVTNRKSNVSPMVNNKKYSNNFNMVTNLKGGMRQQEYDGSRYY